MSQDQFAARLQVEGLRLGQKQISRIENRERVLADFELKIIARVLGLSTDDLLSEESTDKGWYL
jgi:transcriptional regulator with XRE-family HTH domain